MPVAVTVFVNAVSGIPDRTECTQKRTHTKYPNIESTFSGKQIPLIVNSGCALTCRLRLLFEAVDGWYVGLTGTKHVVIDTYLLTQGIEQVSSLSLSIFLK